MPTIDTIAVGGTVLCHVVRTDRLPDITTFATPPEAVIQVGHVVHPRGHEIVRHAHRPVERRVTGTAEVLLVQRGRCEIDVYDTDRQFVRTAELREGDILVMLAGGHGFRMLDDTVLLEVKQGPYLGPDEKELF